MTLGPGGPELNRKLSRTYDMMTLGRGGIGGVLIQPENYDVMTSFMDSPLISDLPTHKEESESD